jgi:SMODS and SLOG-associating 2TM effector domain 1
VSSDLIEQAAPVASSASEPPVDDGCIPFRLRIGVTGHVDLEPTETLAAVLRQQIRWIQERIVGSAATPVLLAVVSQLAEGADRLVVDEVFATATARGEEARLEVILPMPRKDYEEAQGFSRTSAAEFARLLECASWIYQPPPTDLSGHDDNAYQAAGVRLVARCDVLIALWNGEPSGGKGGTAETLLEASWRRRPCIWIPTAGDFPVQDNFGIASRAGSLAADDFYFEVRRRAMLRTTKDELPEPTESQDPLESIRYEFVRFDRFNHERVRSNLATRAAEELGPEAIEAGWVAVPLARAADVADAYRDRFSRRALAISILVTAAAGALAASVTFYRALAWVEVAALLVAGAMFWRLRRRDLHGRWLTARVLAERLRAAFYVAPTRRDFHRVGGLEAVYTERQSGDWVQRASEEVWDRRPHASPLDDTLPRDEVEDIRSRVAGWIKGQICYHKRTAGDHASSDARYRLAIASLLILAVVFAVLDAAEVGGRAPLFLAIVLPAAGAAIGAFGTVAQHRALKERSLKMQSDLAVALSAVLDADETQLGPASLDAARIIAAETGDWLGTMWFLDVEHI